MTTRRSSSTLALLTLSLLTGASGLVRAQTPPPPPPDAGSLLKQIEKDSAQRPPQTQRPQTPSAPQDLRGMSGSATVQVRGFAFSGNRLLDEATLAAVVAPWVGRTVDLNELRRAATAVAEAYRARGWVVRAYLPRQDVTEGRISIQVIEAVFGGVHLEGQPASRVPLAMVQQRIERQQAPGTPLNGNALDRGLLLADDLTGVTVAGTLVPGSADGQTALAVKLGDEPLLSGVVALDNSGARSTGEARASALLNLNSPLGQGEQFSGHLLATRGSRYARLAAGQPLGLDGLRVGLNLSHFSYRLISADYSALQAKGSASTAGLDASQPLLRSRQANVYLQAQLDHKHFDNRVQGVSSSRYRIDMASLGLVANRFDEIGGGGANSASLSLSAGRVALNGASAPRVDGSTGRFGKLRYAAARQQTLTRELTLYAALSGQWADKNLDSSERFSLGGPGGVRAYPGNEGSGATGQLLTLEARQRVGQNLSLVAFFDQGWVQQYRRNTDSAGRSLSGASPNSYSLAGHGLGLSWTGPAGLSVNAHWAQRQGRNPNPSLTGRDQDGSLQKQRVWVGIALPI